MFMQCHPWHERPHLADMQVIEAHCASITCMIRHYVSPKGEVIY
jgi:hypothetical protein